MKYIPLTEEGRNKLDPTFFSTETEMFFQECWDKSVAMGGLNEPGSAAETRRLKKDLKGEDAISSEGEVATASSDRVQALMDTTKSFQRQECTVQDSLKIYMESTATSHWVRVLLSPKAGLTINELAQRVRSLSYPLSENPFEADSECEDMFSLFGVLEVRLPPDQKFLHILAHMEEVDYCYNSESLVSIPVPETAEQMFQGELYNARKRVIGSEDLPKAFKDMLGEGIKIGILDSGVDAEHPDIAQALIDQRDFTSERSDPERKNRDYCGHGTHVAGIALGRGAASNEKYIGIAPRAGLISAKVLKSDGLGSTSDILAGLRWLVDQGSDVINVSLGASKSGLKTDGTSILSRACDVVASRGIIVCVAAGNNGPKPGTLVPPADAPEVITVGAVDDKGRIAKFSSRGPSSDPEYTGAKPDIVAPGVDIISARSKDCKWAPYRSNHDYTITSGTSMATPMATGAAALLLAGARQVSPGRDVSEEIKTLLVESAVPGDFHADDAGHGIINVSSAARGLEEELCKKDTEPVEKRDPVGRQAAMPTGEGYADAQPAVAAMSNADEPKSGEQSRKRKRDLWQIVTVGVISAVMAVIGIIHGTHLLQEERAPISEEHVKAADSIYLEGWKQFQAGKEKETIHSFLKAIDLNPREGKYYYSLGLLYSDMGGMIDAWMIWLEGIARDPDCPDLKNILELTNMFSNLDSIKYDKR